MYVSSGATARIRHLKSGSSSILDSLCAFFVLDSNFLILPSQLYFQDSAFLTLPSWLYLLDSTFLTLPS